MQHMRSVSIVISIVWNAPDPSTISSRLRNGSFKTAALSYAKEPHDSMTSGKSVWYPMMASCPSTRTTTAAVRRPSPIEVSSSWPTTSCMRSTPTSTPDPNTATSRSADLIWSRPSTYPWWEINTFRASWMGKGWPTSPLPKRKTNTPIHISYL